jgi:hypothetical protein
MARTFLLFSYLFFSISTLATTLIGIRGKDGFVIAADSKVTYKGHGVNGPATACKIFRSGNLYFALAGMANDPARGFFPSKIVANSFLNSVSFESSINRLEADMSSALKVEMRRLQVEDPELFLESQTGGGDVFTIIAARMVGDVPHMAGRGFKYLDLATPDIEIRRQSCPGDCPGEVHVMFAGEQKTARKLTEDLMKSGKSANPAEFARKLVELEILEAPEKVGPPINVLRVDTKEAAIEPSNGACPIVTELTP